MARTLAWLLACSFSCCAFAQTDDPIVINPSVELSEAGQPVGWQSYSWGKTSKFAYDSGTAHTGLHSLKVVGGMGAWSTSLNVSPGMVLRISFFYRAANVEPGARMLCYLHGKLGGQEKGKTVLWFTRPLRAQEAWQQMDVGDYIVPDDCASLDLALRLNVKGTQTELWFDDLSVVEVQRAVPQGRAAVIVRGPQFSLWAEHASHKVYLDDPIPRRDGEGVSLSAARNEVEAFQLVVRPRQTMDAVSWQWSDLTGPDTIPRACLTYRRVAYIEITQPSGVYGRPGLNPDPLPKETVSVLTAGQNSPFWFDVSVPESVRPGVYRGGLAMMQRDSVVVRVPVELRVRSFAIPRKPSVDVLGNLWLYDVYRFDKGDPFEVAKPYYSSLFAHRLHGAPQCRILLRVAAGRVELDTTEYEKHLEFVRDKTPMGRFNVGGLLWVGHRGTHKWPADAKWHGLRIFLDPDNNALNPEFVALFKEAAHKLMDVLKRHGCYQRPRLKFFDEPNFADKATVNALRNLAKLVKEADPSIEIRTSGAYPHPSMAEYFDEWDMHADMLAVYGDHVAAAAKKGVRIQLYHNSCNLQDLPALRTRAFFWQLWRSRLDGANCWWSLTCWKKNPWHGGQTNSGILLYPPLQEGAHGPVASIRWEMTLQGLEDYEYLRMLESAIASARKLPQTAALAAAIQDADAALERVPEVSQRFPHVSPVNDQPYTLDVSRLDSVRTQVAEAIERVRAAMGPEAD